MDSNDPADLPFTKFTISGIELNWERGREGIPKGNKGGKGSLDEETEEEEGRLCVFEDVCACVCIRRDGGVCKSRGTLWGMRQYPAVPSNGRIELNRVEKRRRLLTQKWSF